jgi:hypothetical protein
MPMRNSIIYPNARLQLVKALVALTYTPWLKDLGLNDVYLTTLAGYYKLDEMRLYLDHFVISALKYPVYDNLGNDLNSFRPRDLPLMLVIP